MGGNGEGEGLLPGGQRRETKNDTDSTLTKDAGNHKPEGKLFMKGYGPEMPKPLWGDGKAPRGSAVESGGAPKTQRMPVEQLLQQLKIESEMKLQQQGKNSSSWPGAQPLPMPGLGQPAAGPAGPAGGAVKNN